MEAEIAEIENLQTVGRMQRSSPTGSTDRGGERSSEVFEMALSLTTQVALPVVHVTPVTQLHT